MGWLKRSEKEVLTLIGQGKTVPEIAKELFRAPTTIETHKRNLLEKLELRNSYELVAYAINNGFVKKQGEEQFL